VFLEELLSGTEDVPKRDKFMTTMPVSQSVNMVGFVKQPDS